MAKTIVMSYGSEDGFEAWRRLHLRYEPRLVIRQGLELCLRHACTVSAYRDPGPNDQTAHRLQTVLGLRSV